MLYCDICGVELSDEDIINSRFVNASEPHCTECLEGLQ